MSPFEEIFGVGSSIKDDDLLTYIAIIRDKFDKEINHYIPEPSMVSSPSCVLYAIYKLLENDLQKKDFKSYEEIEFG